VREALGQGPRYGVGGEADDGKRPYALDVACSVAREKDAREPRRRLAVLLDWLVG